MSTVSKVSITKDTYTSFELLLLFLLYWKQVFKSILIVHIDKVQVSSISTFVLCEDFVNVCCVEVNF